MKIWPTSLVLSELFAYGGRANEPNEPLQSGGLETNRKRFPRDFTRHPATLRFAADRVPQTTYFVGDVHASVDQLTSVLGKMQIIERNAAGPKQDGRCGVIPQAQFGDFRYENPFRWRANDSLLVQTGDILNKGPSSLAAWCFFQDLKLQAEEAGGAVALSAGNHEADGVASTQQAPFDGRSQKTMGPGGVCFEGYHYGVPCAELLSVRHPFGRELAERPFLVQVDTMMAFHAGYAAYRSSHEIDHLIEKEYPRHGMKAPVISAIRGILQGRSPGGPSGKDGPKLASALSPGCGVEIKTIVYGHDPERTPGEIDAYGFNAEHEPSLIAIDVGLSMAYGYSGFANGSLAVARHEGDHYRLEACHAVDDCVALGTVIRTVSEGSLLAPQTDALLARAQPPGDGLAAASGGAWLGRLLQRAVGQAERPSGRQQIVLQPPLVAGQGPTPAALARLDRNFTAYPAIVNIELPRHGHSKVYVQGSSYGDYRRQRELLFGMGLIGHARAKDAGNSSRRPLGLYDDVRWTGGDSVFITTGNRFGYGFAHLESMDLCRELGRQAAAAGGRFVCLLGAIEVDFLANPDSPATYGPGGIAPQLYGLGQTPSDFLAAGGERIQALQNSPICAHVADSLICPGGQTSSRNWQDMDTDLAEALARQGFAAALVSGPNSCTKAIGFAGRDGRQGPLLAKTAGVSNIIHGLDEHFGVITGYGKKKDGEPSLINVESIFNTARGNRTGSMLVIRRQADAYRYDVCEDAHTCKPL